MLVLLVLLIVLILLFGAGAVKGVLSRGLSALFGGLILILGLVLFFSFPKIILGMLAAAGLLMVWGTIHEAELKAKAEARERERLTDTPEIAALKEQRLQLSWQGKSPDRDARLADLDANIERLRRLHEERLK